MPNRRRRRRPRPLGSQWAAFPGQVSGALGSPRAGGESAESNNRQGMEKGVRPDLPPGSAGRNDSSGDGGEVTGETRTTSSECGQRRDDVQRRHGADDRGGSAGGPESRPQRLRVAVSQRQWAVV